MKRRAVLIAGVLVVVSWSQLAGVPLLAAQVGEIAFDTLLDDLVDLPRLTRLPEPAYTTKQFSSYDQASKSPSVEWFANGDFGQYVRVEDKDGRKEHVMADMDGPGAIVRIWSANPKGVLRIYIDGAPKPVIEAPMTALLGGTVAGIPVPLAGERARGWNLYLPIPYGRHCKVTSDEGGFYYHVNYRTYAVGAKVASFSMADLQRARHKVFDIAAKLLSTREDVPPPAGRVKKPFDANLKPDAEQVLFEDKTSVFSGPKTICGFLVHIAAKDLDAAARGVVLYMTFDGEQTVECPLGDFFGTAPGLIPYASLPLGITGGSTPDLWCHWYMPYKQSATVRVKNLGGQDVQVSGAVATYKYDWDNARSMHFNAGWRQEKRLLTRPFTDWAHLECTGAGRFVGGALHVQNPVRGWWGEGDEKIYVDGEKFPSHFGTGSEDYYGYAWCSPERFVHAYHNQPRCDGPNNYGNSSVNRFHIIDDIPFTSQFKFDIENWHSVDKSYTNRAAVSYWYARPGGKDFFKSITKEDVKIEALPAFLTHKVKDAQEAERLKPEKAEGQTRAQDLGGQEGKWSDMRQLWWTEAKPGDKLTLTFESPAAGQKNVILAMTKSQDYAIVQTYVNDVKVGEPIDLYHGSVTPTGPIDLGPIELRKGANKLTVEIVGANEKAAKSYMVGLDYVLVK